MPEELKQLETAKYQGVEPYYLQRPNPSGFAFFAVNHSWRQHQI